jgi:protein-disulfide isomerase
MNRSLTPLLLCLTLLIGGFWAAEPLRAADALDTQAKGAIEGIIQEYLKTHPEVIEEALQLLEQRRQEQAKRRSKEAIVEHEQELFHDPDSPIHGNPAGDVTIVEFFDYRCRYCRAVAGVVAQLLKDDPQVKLIYKDFPILGEASVVASRAALASRSQGKYPAFHEALMAAKAELTEETVLGIARDVGLDADRLAADMKNPAIPRVRDRSTIGARSHGSGGDERTDCTGPHQIAAPARLFC